VTADCAANALHMYKARVADRALHNNALTKHKDCAVLPLGSIRAKRQQLSRPLVYRAWHVPTTAAGVSSCNQIRLKQNGRAGQRVAARLSLRVEGLGLRRTHSN
jgi:hypothetical protein